MTPADLAHAGPTHLAVSDRSNEALLELCTGLLPVWARHVASSQAQTETAVMQMLKAFADIGPHIDMAERQSQQINDALTRPMDGVCGLVEACEHALGPVLGDAQLPAASRAAVENVLGLVRQTVGDLGKISKPFQHETQMVAEQVDRMYVGFQFHDRTSQMMALLADDISRLRQVLQTPDAPVPPLATWMAQLEMRYAMAEQRQDAVATPADTPNSDHNETTFF